MRRLATDGILCSLCDFQGQTARQLPAPACQESTLQQAMIGGHVWQLTCSVKHVRLHTMHGSTLQPN